MSNPRRIRTALLFIIFTLVFQAALFAGIRSARQWRRARALPPPVVETYEGQGERVAVGFIGDDLSQQGAREAMPLRTCKVLAKVTGHPTRAVSVAMKGSTTEEWRPGAPEGYLARAVAAFKREGVTLVSVMLGTFDARPPAETPPARYAENVRAIRRALEAEGFRVVFHEPPRPRDPAAAVLLAKYRPLNVYDGERRAFDYFGAHTTELADDGLLLTNNGRGSLALLWAFALSDKLPTP